jgi:N-acetyl-alpha-D-glucosaminyl L-malate synthase BshA
VAVFERVREKIPAKLLLVGDGPERRRLEQYCQEKGLFEDVRFLGEIEAIEEVLSVADVFLMPSAKESFGLAALEAMACEVPVIASNTGGLPELIEQGISGFMSQVEDVEDMAKNALFILEDANLPTFKTQALRRAKEFDVAHILPKYEDLYHLALKK